MKKRLIHVSPLQAGIVFSAVSAVNSLVFLLPMFFFVGLVSSLAHHAMAGTQGFQQNANPFGLLFGGIGLIILPVTYAIFGFIFGIIAALVYNLVAKWTGGLEFITADLSADTPPAALPPTPYGRGNDPY